jgi:hypothetical protein
VAEGPTLLRHRLPGLGLLSVRAGADQAQADAAAPPTRRSGNGLALFALFIAQSVGANTRFVHGYPISSLFGAGALGKAGQGIASPLGRSLTSVAPFRSTHQEQETVLT